MESTTDITTFEHDGVTTYTRDDLEINIASVHRVDWLPPFVVRCYFGPDPADCTVESFWNRDDAHVAAIRHSERF
jgi:hypothetical protein